MADVFPASSRGCLQSIWTAGALAGFAPLYTCAQSGVGTAEGNRANRMLRGRMIARPQLTAGFAARAAEPTYSHMAHNRGLL